MKSYILILMLYVSSLVACSYAPKNQMKFVSPSGNDNSTGTIETPFQTIERAKQELKKIKQRSKGPINVFLRGGKYQLKNTILFGLEDSGTKESLVTYQAYQD
jgi:hypothetical protein